MLTIQTTEEKNELNQVYTKDVVVVMDESFQGVLYDLHTQRPTKPLEIVHNNEVLYSSVKWWYDEENSKYRNLTGK